MITKDDLIAFSKGKKKGFDKIYEAYSPGMYSICLRYLNSEDDAKDALQDAFTKVYNHRSTYKIELPIGAWIKTITIRCALSILKERNKFESFDEMKINSNPLEIEIEESDHDLKKSLELALKKLPDGYRTVFNLFAIDNLTHKEIASYLSITEGTSKSQYSKAKAFLQKLLQSEKLAS